MEERQTQIREGAGLEESKLNVEFIDWLRKWSTPIMGVVAVIALGFVVANRMEKSRQAAVDKAFEEFESAAQSASPNPETLKTVAAENAGIRAVPVMAELEAADLYLRSARLGLRLGAKPKEDGTFPAEEILTAEQRETNLTEADRLYRKILDGVGGDPKKAVLALSAAYGVAAVAETRGNQDAARQAYERAGAIAEAAGFALHAEVAKKRIERLPNLSEVPKLLAAADLPKPPEPPQQDPAQPGAATVTPVYQPVPMPEAPAAPEAPKPADPKPPEPK